MCWQQLACHPFESITALTAVDLSPRIKNSRIPTIDVPALSENFRMPYVWDNFAFTDLWVPSMGSLEKIRTRHDVPALERNRRDRCDVTITSRFSEVRATGTGVKVQVCNKVKNRMQNSIARGKRER